MATNNAGEVLDPFSIGVLGVDQTGKITVFNSTCSTFFRVETKKAVGQNVFNVFPKSCLPGIVDSAEPVLNKTFRNDDGRTIVTNGLPIVRNGRVIGAIASFVELKQFKETYQHLFGVTSRSDEDNNVMRLAFEASYDGIAIVEYTGRFVYMNAAFCGFLGTIGSNEEHTALTMEGVFSGPARQLIAQVRQRGQPVTVTEQLEDCRTALITGNPVFSNGRLRYVVINVRDVTELPIGLGFIANEAKLAGRSITPGGWAEVREVVAASPAMKRIIEMAYRVAAFSSTILILGETGVGKGIIARVIHESSPCHAGPFVKVNCASIPESLLESELFGYEKGSFTGANREGKLGLFETANGGTLFLDEIGEMPLAVQVKLLHALEDRVVYRLGGTKPVALNARIIAATNEDPYAMVQGKRFRKDLYYRLNVVPIVIPPLRERPEDIRSLLDTYLARLNQKYGYQRRFSDKAQRMLEEYKWPGNVREVINLVERLFVLATGDTISAEDVAPWLSQELPVREDSLAGLSLPPGECTLQETLEAVERQMIITALRRLGSTRKAAKVLGVDPSTLSRKAKKYCLT